MAEKQTCPRRIECGRHDKKDADLWVTDRWYADEAVVKAKHDAEDALGLREHNDRNAYRSEPPITMDEYRTKWHIRGHSNDLWLWSWGPPRTCNFCGGIHPEDALRLLSEGWEAEATTKNYKRYLAAPGTATMHKAFMASLKNPQREPGDGVPSIWTPTPSVKVYFQHFTPAQGERWNQILNALKARPS